MRTTLNVASTVLAFTAVFTPGAVSAQNTGVVTISPGDGQMDGRRIPASTRTWQSSRVHPDSGPRLLARWYDTLSIVERDGQQILRRVQHIVREQGPTTVLLNEAERISLLPRLSVARAGSGDPFIDLRFDGNRISGRRPLVPHGGTAADQEMVSMTLDLPAPVYDWRWWGLLAAALPLRADYSARFLALATESTLAGPLILVTVRVVGETTLAGVPCWVVEVQAGMPWTLWIARGGDGHPVQRISIAQPDGSALVWEPIEQ